MGRVRGDTAERPPQPARQEVLAPWPGQWPWGWMQGSWRGQKGLPRWGGTQGSQASSPCAEVHMWCYLSNPSLTLGSQSAIRPRYQGLRHPSEACVLSIPV